MEGLLFIFPDSSRFNIMDVKFDDVLFLFFISFVVCDTDRILSLTNDTVFDQSA